MARELPPLLDRSTLDTITPLYADRLQFVRDLTPSDKPLDFYGVTDDPHVPGGTIGVSTTLDPAEQEILIKKARNSFWSELAQNGKQDLADNILNGHLRAYLREKDSPTI